MSVRPTSQTAHVHDVLLTTDFSENARRAYGTATSIARRLGARVHLAHALVSGEHAWAPGASTEVERELAETELRREIATHPGFAGLDTQAIVVRHRWPHKGLEEYAREAGIDLVVTATHGWAGLTRFLLGSFAERLARNARRPVLVVRRPGEGAASFTPRNVLVPYDYSPIAAAVLPMVRMLAEHYGCSFTFLYVQENRHAPFLERLRMPIELRTSRVVEQFRTLREEELAGVDAQLVITRGTAYEEVLRTAREVEADLVVLATHGLLGALSQNVLRALDCSVLTVFTGSSDERAADSTAEDDRPADTTTSATQSTT